jgi:HEAT repeat protein
VAWRTAITFFLVLDAGLLAGVVVAAFAAAANHGRHKTRDLDVTSTPEPVSPALARLEAAREREVLETLVTIGIHSSTYLGALVAVTQLIRDGSERVRLVATWVLVQMIRHRPELVPVLIEDASPLVRLAVVTGVVTLQRRRRGHVPNAGAIILKATGDSETAIRHAAVAALCGASGNRAVRDSLLKVLSSEASPPLRATAARALGTVLADADSVQRLQTLASADVASQRILLAELSRTGHTVDSHLIAVVSNPAAPQRLAAIRLLGSAGGARAEALIAQFLSDPDDQVRSEGAAAAAWIARTAYPAPISGALGTALVNAAEQETTPAVVGHLIEAISYSRDKRAPAALLKRIPVSAGPVKDRLIEAVALYERLNQWAPFAAERVGADV